MKKSASQKILEELEISPDKNHFYSNVAMFLLTDKQKASIEINKEDILKNITKNTSQKYLLNFINKTK